MLRRHGAAVVTEQQTVFWTSSYINKFLQKHREVHICTSKISFLASLLAKKNGVALGIINNEDLNCPHFSIEQVHQCKYLGTNINDTNSIDEEIKASLVLGTKANYAHLKFFKSRLVTKHSKLRWYRSVIRPIVTYAAETWVLKESSIQKLLVFERKIL
jgi:hypothetical protein